MNDIIILPVSDKKMLKRFVRLVDFIYKDDPNFILPITFERMEALSWDKNPYFEHADVQYFIAVKNGVDVGRISAQVDTLIQKKWGPNLGHFGLFEATDSDVAHALFEAAKIWLKERGMTRMQGPWSLSSNEECGLLIDGFEYPPVVMMPHGLPAYQKYFESEGFEKAKDLYAYERDSSTHIPERMQRIVNMTAKNKRTHIREIDMKNFRAELDIIMDIFNEAWSDNWGYVQLTEHELQHMADSLKPIVHPKRTVIVEVDGEPAAFMITIPDINHYLADLKGKLLPFGWAKILYRIFISKYEPRHRVPLMGVRTKFQKSPLGAGMAIWMIHQCQEFVIKRGSKFGELGWILEDNDGMNNMLKSIGCTVYKTYRIYERKI